MKFEKLQKTISKRTWEPHMSGFLTRGPLVMDERYWPKSQKLYIKIASVFLGKYSQLWEISPSSSSWILSFKSEKNAHLFRFEFFQTAIWLLHNQLWAIIKGTASLTQGELPYEVRSSSPAKLLLGFESGNFRF